MSAWDRESIERSTRQPGEFWIQMDQVDDANQPGDPSKPGGGGEEGSTRWFVGSSKKRTSPPGLLTGVARSIGEVKEENRKMIRWFPS